MKLTLSVAAVVFPLTLIACGGAPQTPAARDSGATPEQSAAPTAAANTGAAAPAPATATGLAAATPAAREIEAPAGTVVVVRITQALSTARNRAGDEFTAVLDDPVMIDGRPALEKGTRFTGHVTESASSARLKGRGVLGITLDSVEIGGQRQAIRTSLDTRATDAHKKRNIELIGGGAGVGAVIGAIAGGGKGAAVGAAVGAGAGTGTAAATGKKEVEVPAETVFQFSLKEPLKIRG